MKILLLGGSNAGVSFGWAEQFRLLAVDHVVTNRFLGAVGSLFGLLRVMRLATEEGPRPDLVVFEYALNDSILMQAGSLLPALLRDTLDDLASHCHRLGIPLLLLVLDRRPTDDGATQAIDLKVARAYERMARAHGAALMTLRDVCGPVSRDLFADENHLTERTSQRVAGALIQRIAAAPIPVPKPASGADLIRFVPATAAMVEGPHRSIDVESTVFRGTFVELGRGGISRWSGRGHLVGVMLCSTEATGAYAITTAGHAVRKNAQSRMREIVPKLLLLHYLARPILIADDLVIAMPTDEAALMALPLDLTALETSSTTRFPDQTLTIHGIMIWRVRSRWHRWRETIHGAVRSLHAPG